MSTFLITEFTPSACIRKNSDGILSLSHLPEKKECDICDFRNNFEIIKKIQNGKTSPFLWDTSCIEKIGKEEKNFVLESLPYVANSVAIIYNRHNAVIRMTMNLLFYLKRPEVPTRIFSEKEKGETWLKRFA